MHDENAVEPNELGLRSGIAYFVSSSCAKSRLAELMQ